MAPENPFYHNPLKSNPKWKRGDLIKVIDELVCAEGGYVYYGRLCEL